jgi:hypothetical protein
MTATGRGSKAEGPMAGRMRGRLRRPSYGGPSYGPAHTPTAAHTAARALNCAGPAFERRHEDAGSCTNGHIPRSFRTRLPPAVTATLRHVIR